MACVETRQHKLPTVTLRWRRYRNEAGDMCTTCEVPTELWNRIAVLSGETELVVTRGNAAKSPKRDKALQLLADGCKVMAIAQELGLSESTIRRYNKERKQNGLR